VGVGGRVALGVIAALALVFGGAWAVGMAQASALRVTVRVSPRVVPADGQTPATVTIRIQNPDGTPRVGDIVDALDLSPNPGSLLIYRAATDRRGQVSFTYTPAMANQFVPTVPAKLQITDSSLGSLVEIDRMMTVMIDVVDPSKVKK